MGGKNISKTAIAADWGAVSSRPVVFHLGVEVEVVVDVVDVLQTDRAFACFGESRLASPKRFAEDRGRGVAERGKVV